MRLADQASAIRRDSGLSAELWAQVQRECPNLAALGRLSPALYLSNVSAPSQLRRVLEDPEPAVAIAAGLVEAWRAQSEGAGAKVVVLIDTSLATP